MDYGMFSVYIELYISNLEKINDRSKAEFFYSYLKNYLKEEMGGVLLDRPDIFSILDKDFLLASIKSFISERNPVKNVAESYKRTIIELCEKVCTKYSIRNDFLENYLERSEFDKEAAELFSSLKQSEPRGCMSSDDYEILEEKFRSFLALHNLGDMIEETIGKKKGPNPYGRLVSAIAFKLVDKFGLGNSVVANLKITDLNLEQRELQVNKFHLKLDDNLVANFELYLKYRALLLNSYSLETDVLFIARTGKPYINKYNQAENGRLFIQVDKDKAFDVTGLQNRTIIRMVAKGANVNLLCELTGTDEKTIGRICDYNEKDIKAFEDLFGNVRETRVAEKEKQAKGLIRCPFCGEYQDASSKNWILIQIEGDDNKYIACRECRGYDGKYRY